MMAVKLLSSHQYVNNLGLEPEDAWLTAMVNWVNGVPIQKTKMQLAHSMIQFLDANEGKIPPSAFLILGARQAMADIITTAAPPVVSTYDSQRVAGQAASMVDYYLEENGVKTLLGGSLILDHQYRVSFRGGREHTAGSIVAFVALGDLKESQIFRALDAAGIDDSTMYQAFVDQLVYAAVRDLEQQLSEAREQKTEHKSVFTCPHCGQRTRVSVSDRQRIVKCFNCLQAYEVGP